VVQASRTQAANRRTLLKLAGVALGMFGFGYALVPLYDVFCDITGIRLTDQGRAAAPAHAAVDTSRWITVEFTGNAMAGLPWEFRAVTRKLRLHPGETAVATFYAVNRSPETIVGQAVPSVSPPRASRYFKKNECFCFTQQKLDAGERREMAVRFRVDPRLPKEVKTITLSYAFFNTDKLSASRYGGAAAPAGAKHGPQGHHG